MDAEERTQTAITLTRRLLQDALYDPGAIVEMTIWEASPEDVENKVYDILCYLEKTAPKKPEEAEG